MLLKQIIEVFDVLDDACASGESVIRYLHSIDENARTSTWPLTGAKGTTDMVRVLIPGTNGKSSGGTAPTLGILGRLGGIGARPAQIGFVSDGDGALACLAAAAKLLDMAKKGDRLEGDVICSTQICPHAPAIPHKPVPFMGAPAEMKLVNAAEIDGRMDAILSIDTTKGNRIINHSGFALSPTVKEGWILKVSDDLLDIMSTVTGKNPYVFALTMQDITPYGNDVYHLNSILQPATAADAPVVGVAITTETAVAGCASGATSFTSVEETARFAVETAKAYGRGLCSFYDEEEYEHLVSLYGNMKKITGR